MRLHTLDVSFPCKDSDHFRNSHLRDTDLCKNGTRLSSFAWIICGTRSDRFLDGATKQARQSKGKAKLVRFNASKCENFEGSEPMGRLLVCSASSIRSLPKRSFVRAWCSSVRANSQFFSFPIQRSIQKQVYNVITNICNIYYLHV